MSQELFNLLQPLPQFISFGAGKELEVKGEVSLSIENTINNNEFIQNFSQLLKNEFGITVCNSQSGKWSLKLSMNPLLFKNKLASYKLFVENNLVTIISSDESGLFYGMQTLIQIIRLSKNNNKSNISGDTLFTIQHVTIQDSPDFLNRGVMLDISRDKVYKLETVKLIVDMLASFKYNQLQLYMEHTFAYSGHEEVWKDASPFTPAEISELHDYCKARFIELVPNQNSFGHMHRWLQFEKYKQLAEVPEGILHGFNNKVEPYSICPTNPDSLAFLKDLYSQLLPNFKGASQLNVGLDETFDLGKGQSKAECETKGVEVVYMEFLQKIYSLLKSSFPGTTMQFWGDIILHRPDLIPKLPKDIIALDWGYEDKHPFAKSTKMFSESGISFYVCPGTSSWNTIGGRVNNSYENLQNAAENGSNNGAIGYLVTDWGDHGHWQQLPISFFGFVAGSGFAWNVKASKSIEIEEGIARIGNLLDEHVFKGVEKIHGKFLLDLGRAYLHTKCLIGNQSSLFRMILFPNTFPTLQASNRPTSENLLNTKTFLQQTLEEYKKANKNMDREDQDVILEELQFTCEFLIFACDFGAAYAQATWEQGQEKIPVASLSAEIKQSFSEKLQHIIQRFTTRWNIRNRPGGLRESVGRLESLLKQLQ